MTNLLTSPVPQTSGRALFSTGAAIVLPNEAASGLVSGAGIGTSSVFGDAFRGAQAPTLDVFAASGEHVSSVSGKPHEDETEPAEDSSPALLQSIAPVVLTLVPVTPVETKSASSIQQASAADAAAVSTILAAGVSVDAKTPFVAARVPGAVVSVPDNGVPQARVLTNTSALPGTVANTASPDTDVASTTPVAVPPTDVLRGNGAREVLATGGDRAIALVAPQWQSMPAMSITAGAEVVTASAPPPTDAAGRQSLATALGDRIHVQINQRSEHAVIRLDPPSMGTIEIIIRQEAGELHVQLRASHSEVARQLHAIGDTLRQDLVQRQQNDVSVQVWDDSRGGEGRRQRPAAPWSEEPGRALSEAGDNEEPATFAFNSGEARE